MSLRTIAIPVALASASLATLGGIAAFIASCGGDMPTGPAGGPASGSADMHCIDPATGQMTTQAVSQADCQFRPPIDAPGPDAGSNAPDAAPDAAPYGPTMYDQAGNDDDCKYHVAWTATPIYENYDVFFSVVATTTTDGQPATGAAIDAEVYLSDTHEAPPTHQTVQESPPGTYKVGPIQFDAPGMWTVRFHLHENCLDYADDSPHGHAAFFVDVP